MKSRFVGLVLAAVLAVAPAFGENTQVGSIKADMVKKNVEVEGTVGSFQAARSEKAPNSFKLKDSSGDIRVCIWSNALDALPNKADLKDGAKVKVKAEVAEFKGAIELHVNDAKDLKIEGGSTAPAAEKSADAPKSADAAPGAAKAATGSGIGAITLGQKDEVVTVKGTVASVKEPSSERAPVVVKVKDDSGTIDVVYWADFAKSLGPDKTPAKGDTVEVKGKVNEYRGAIQLQPAAAADLKVTKGAGAAPAEKTSDAKSPETSAAPAKAAAGSGIAAITEAQKGQVVTVTGKVTGAKAPSNEKAPYVFKVTDETGTIDVVFWADFAKSLADNQKAEKGDMVQIKGKVNDYRGTIQLQPETAADFKTEKSDPALFQKKTSGDADVKGPQSAAPEMDLGRVADLAAKQKVTISGQVAAVTPIRAGQRVTLKDSTGQMDVLLWDTAVGLKPASGALKADSKLLLTGIVEQVDGKNILVVSQPENVLSVMP
ncbi:MAG: hypothetical protein K1X53_06865 [Candidatus Sumerlaeaceae bacterium]|nr:hypothetical protein [Candidatus Sumerlaeaceae bacterium]